MKLRPMPQMPPKPKRGKNGDDFMILVWERLFDQPRSREMSHRKFMTMVRKRLYAPPPPQKLSQPMQSVLGFETMDDLMRTNFYDAPANAPGLRM
jgi:hypothetical protein